MEQVVGGTLESILAKETWTIDDHREMLSLLSASGDASRKLGEIIGEMESQSPEPKGAAALKIGIARFMMCRFERALDALSDATDNKERHYYQAQCHKSLRQYDKAVEELARAKDRGWDGSETDLQTAEVHAMAGDLDAAAAALARLQAKVGDKPDFHYIKGLIDEIAGRRQEAAEAYEQARAADPNHGPATFRMAYFWDMAGEEEAAVELYKRCLTHPLVYANALINLAVLYEDMGRFDQAIACLRRVLSVNPNHLRARLFLKDAEASRTMYYDEDQARRTARHNAVLDIPVTDFELSVRARNCLRKMNVRNLGDLVRTTEADLLSYKNFGETSLKEIKDMLSSKGLRLGQAAEEEASELLPRPAAPPPKPQTGAESVLATPLAQIEFSVRARKALESLNLRTLGDLAQKTESELLACRNFGQTSLNEVGQRLAEYGLKLREPG